MNAKVQRFLSRLGYWLHRNDDLTRFLNESGSDKGLVMLGRYFYSRVSSMVFYDIFQKQLNIGEIGL